MYGIWIFIPGLSAPAVITTLKQKQKNNKKRTTLLSKLRYCPDNDTSLCYCNYLVLNNGNQDLFSKRIKLNIYDVSVVYGTEEVKRADSPLSCTTT